LTGVERVPYRLPELIAAPATTTIYIAEGEKDVDSLRSHILVATCNPGGAGKWRASYSQYLKSHDVILLPDNDQAGEAHMQDVAAKLAGIARSIRILRLPDLSPKGDVSDWFAAGGTAEKLEQLAAEAPQLRPDQTEEAPTTETMPDDPLIALPKNIQPTEDAVAHAFSEAYAGEFIYDHTAECWFIWKDNRRALDIRRCVFHRARQFSRAVRTKFSDPPPALAKIAFISAVERAARADPKMAVSNEIWDTNPWLLGTPDGVVDLKTGILHPNKPDLYISRYTTVVPAAPGTSAPLWQSFFNSATSHDKELQDFLYRWCGYCLTGFVNEEVMVFLYGTGGNGKGVLLAVQTGVLGALSVPISVFTAGSHLNLEYYHAQMAGARLITASEPEVQATWAESQIKELTGNERKLSGRHPYGQPSHFAPEFKIEVVGNHAPKLRGRSPAMERRLRVLPFKHEPKLPNPNLKDELKAEYPAILRLMIDGCVAWQQNGLGTAAAIATATNTYFEQQDAFRRWMDERCKLHESLKLKPSILLADFNAWAKRGGNPEWQRFCGTDRPYNRAQADQAAWSSARGGDRPEFDRLGRKRRLAG
jgi:putative DNA primase/helicase